MASLDYRFCNLIGSPPSRDTTSDNFSDRLLHDALWLALVQDWLWVNVHLVVWLCGAGLAAFIAKYFTIETRSALCHTFIIATLNPLAQWASRRQMKASNSRDMTTTHTTKVNGSLASWTLIADSDGARGRTGFQKQYVVTINLLDNGKFLVRKYWGKAETHFSQLQNSEVGTYPLYGGAFYAAREVVNAKLDTQYEVAHHEAIKLVNA